MTDHTEPPDGCTGSPTCACVDCWRWAVDDTMEARVLQWREALALVADPPADLPERVIDALCLVRDYAAQRAAGEGR